MTYKFVAEYNDMENAHTAFTYEYDVGEDPNLEKVFDPKTSLMSICKIVIRNKKYRNYRNGLSEFLKGNHPYNFTKSMYIVASDGRKVIVMGK